jgi:hypothetical protein
MYSWNDPDDRVTIARMNTELRDVQLDLLSARCSTDRLRERFSVKALAQYAEKEVLRKMIGHATALSDYYVSIEKEIPGQTPALDESQLADAIELVAQYLREQRDRHPYLPAFLFLRAARGSALPGTTREACATAVFLSGSKGLRASQSARPYAHDIPYFCRHHRLQRTTLRAWFFSRVGSRCTISHFGSGTVHRTLCARISAHHGAFQRAP